MKKILAVALVALAAACSNEEKTIEWGPSQDPTTAQRSAVASSEVTLQGSLDYQASTEPSAGAAGLGDRIAADLSYASASAPGDSSAKFAQDSVRQAWETGTIDPTCVQPTVVGDVTTWTWTNCHVDASDPQTGQAIHVTINGWLAWNPVLRETSWAFGEVFDMTMTSGLDTLTMDGTAALGGKLAVTDTRIVADTSSTAHVRTSMTGPSGNFAFDEDVSTTLTARLDYVADPFCVTGGTLTVVQKATAFGMTEFQGWEITWTGCDQFRIRQGS
ncbi:MAG TPA: hypothetical protein VFL83_16910 [Anaeromyxobacter sp.]|nr:hypothetical protein [Anaeromyxobacter sp.]